MATEFYDTTWGQARLWCSNIVTDNSRTLLVHDPAEGDEHPTQDQGLGTRRVTCELLFVEMPNEARSPLERLRVFKALVDEPGGEARILNHPVEQPFYAHVEGFNYTIDEDGNIEASATFVRAAQPAPPEHAASGTAAVAGEEAVAARAEELRSELAAVGLSSGVMDAAIAAQVSWLEPDVVPTRQVIVDVAALSAQLGALIEDAGLERDLALWGAYRAAILFGAAVRGAALAALAETPRLMSILIGEPIALLALCARIYGGAEALDRERQIRALNDLRTPGWLTAGTVLILPVPTRPR